MFLGKRAVRLVVSASCSDYWRAGSFTTLRLEGSLLKIKKKLYSEMPRGKLSARSGPVLAGTERFRQRCLGNVCVLPLPESGLRL